MKDKHFIHDENGATAIEYGMMAALLGLAIMLAITSFEGSLTGAFNATSSSLDEVTIATKRGGANSGQDSGGADEGSGGDSEGGGADSGGTGDDADPGGDGDAAEGDDDAPPLGPNGLPLR